MWNIDAKIINEGYPILRDIVLNSDWNSEWETNAASLTVPETNEGERFVGAPLDAYIIEDALDLAWISYVINELR